MSSSSIPTARLIVGGLYLLKALGAGVGLAVMGLGAFVAGPGALLPALFFGVLVCLYGGIGVGLLKGHRVALALAIAFAGLGAIGALTGGLVVPFFMDAAIFCGLLLSRDVRKAYA
jgi:hypothetical protein